MSEWFLYFLFYSFAGYCLEKLFAWATRARKQVRKCFLLLPLCPVYGLAMTAVLAAAAPGMGFWGLVLPGGLICTAVEYFVHLFYEKVFRVAFWDYSSLRGNIRGRVCPQFSAAWGLLSAAAVQWVQPAAALAAEAARPGAVYVLWLLLSADCVISGAVLLRGRDTELLSVRAALAHRWASSQSSTS